MATQTSTVAKPALSYPPFTDTLAANTITYKKRHVDELRTDLTTLQTHYHTFTVAYGDIDSGPPLAAPTYPPFVDTTISENVTHIRALHVQELINALKQQDGHYHYVPKASQNETVGANTAAYAGGFTYQKDPVVANTDQLAVGGAQQLRDYLALLKAHTHTVVCDCECTCTCTCTCQCTCTCECTCTND